MEPLLAEPPLDHPFVIPFVSIGQEERPHAEAVEDPIRDGKQHPGPVAGLRVGGDGPSVPDAPEGLEGQRQDLA